ncbi:MAG: transpeptidase family protein [Bradymonadaceae bacterium]|nr:transpeptidase family protein [Lujinxingiaceae bacterium]
MRSQGDDEKARKWMKVRMGLIASVFVLGFVGVVGRVYYLQTVEAEALSKRSATQLNRDVTRQARRGNVVDRNGTELAVSVEVPSVFARPRSIENPEREARRLLPHLNTTYEALVEKLSSQSNFVWLERQARPPSAEAITNLGIPGIGITNEFKRYYPLRERAGQILGFVGIDGDGLEGIERMLNKEMAGATYQMNVSRDAQGRPMITNETPRFRDFEGYSVQLTIDEKIQAVAEAAIARQVEQFSARGGYAVVLDVHTGDILAMANTPYFDPNRVGDFISDDWRLRNVTDTFEPGSIFKPFVLAAALQEKTITLNSTFDCEGGRMRVGGYTIRDVKRHNTLTAAQIQQVSSNIGSYKIAQTIGRERYYEYIRSFGFGGRTGVGLRGEQPGMLWPPDRWAEISFANVAFGQGLTTTPIQLAAATAAIANGGMLLKPRIIDAVLDRDGKIVRHNPPTLVRRVISPEVARDVAWAMSLVTVEGGTGQRAAIEGFTVAGKTGTAQKVNPETRRYDPNLWMAGFVGFAPAEKPEIVVVVIIDEPKKMHYGGVVAGPAFATIARETLALRGVFPMPEEQRFQVGKRPVAQKSALEPAAPAAVFMLPAMRVLDSESDGLLEDGEEEQGGPKVPDFRQMTLRQAMRRAQDLGTSPSIEGWGRVVSQEPKAGDPLPVPLVLTLVLSPASGQGLISDEPSTGTLQ